MILQSKLKVLYHSIQILTTTQGKKEKIILLNIKELLIKYLFFATDNKYFIQYEVA